MVTVSRCLNVTFASSFYARVVFLSLQTSLGWLSKTWRNCTELPPKLEFVVLLALEIGQKCDSLLQHMMVSNNLKLTIHI